MPEYIERERLYNELCRLEDLARKRVIDTPTNSPAFARYNAQLSERTTLKYLVLDAPAADVAPVVHGHWKEYEVFPLAPSLNGYPCSVCGWHLGATMFASNYCPNCGAKMKKGVG